MPVSGPNVTAKNRIPRSSNVLCKKRKWFDLGATAFERERTGMFEQST
jgi:hypothetical protein